jgi:hypothetical protein
MNITFMSKYTHRMDLLRPSNHRFHMAHSRKPLHHFLGPFYLKLRGQEQELQSKILLILSSFLNIRVGGKIQTENLKLRNVSGEWFLISTDWMVALSLETLMIHLLKFPPQQPWVGLIVEGIKFVKSGLTRTLSTCRTMMYASCLCFFNVRDSCNLLAPCHLQPK